LRFEKSYECIAFMNRLSNGVSIAVDHYEEVILKKVADQGRPKAGVNKASEFSDGMRDKED